MGKRNKSKGSSEDGSKKGATANSSGERAPVTTDTRFARVHYDPRFQRAKKDSVKIDLDERFSHMMTSEEFSGKPKVDQYGRKLQENAGQRELKRYYRIREEEKNSAASSDEDEEGEEEYSDQELDAQIASNSSDESNEESDSILHKEEHYDPMRGEGVASSSESIEGEDEDPLGDATKRIGVVNLDWDHLKPDGTTICSVKIYTSEFGKQRLEQIFDEEVTEESLEFDQNALRKYQIERLRYYFAVVECDKTSTAHTIYQQCDGAEVEATSNFFDLRFIPDDMTFDDEPVGVATSSSQTHKKLDFATQALQHSNITLTWDDDDPDRAKVMRQKFNKNELQEMDFKAYLATSSDESEGEGVEDMRQRYKSLLKETAADDDEDAAPEGDMEITFTPGLSEAASELLEKKKAREEQKEETTLDKYLRKQREKRQARKEKQQQKHSNTTDNGNALYSDGEVDMDDPYFREALEEEGFAVDEPTSTKTRGKKNKKNERLTEEEKLERDRERAELELLLMDSKDDREHFDMKKIIKNEKRKGKKQNRKRHGNDDNDDNDELQDNFKVDVSDPRFAALHESHHFAIDPTNPQFKKTNAMKQLLDERQRRNIASKAEESASKIMKDKSNHTNNGDKSLAMLVNSVKRKTGHYKQKGDMRKRTRTE
ncbi:hypothetical protein BDF19DRAFT_448050 [Syncephalis fuscata]|nr:hypothetical protein BDF19DRAFT_448050 [Syncephalis fuscata]